MKQLANHSIQRPPLALLGVEPFRAAMEFARHKFASPSPTPRGDGHPVVIFPGLGADGKSVAILRNHCRDLGYEAFDWGQGFNTGPKGDLDTWMQSLQSRVAELLEDYPQKATLIGWSLGGLYAREIAKLMAPQVRQVITIGTPFNADADLTNVGWLFRLLSGNTSPMDPTLSQRLRTPPPVRTTSIYSRSDGVVAWQTCRHDKITPLVHEIEVDSSHIGMGWNREVLTAVAERLGQPAARSRRYARTN